MGFTKDFVWGAAAASYQIEGAAYEDGKGKSVWDTFSHTEGKVKNNDHGDIACDHYHRYKEDVALMKELGLKAYRFSVSWPRILPNGAGTVNQKGLEFYGNLVDELLANGIEPYVTLFHWELPQVLYEQGGWLNRETTDYFAEFAKIVVEYLSDRVTKWITTNEPQCHILLGHQDGTHAPGDQRSERELFTMMHHIHLAHGKAVQMIRQYAKQPCIVGYAPNPFPFMPVSTSEADYQVAKNVCFSATQRNLWSNTWWLDPVLLGSYPADGLETYKDAFPFEVIRDGDMELISQPIDFLGINMYQGSYVKSDKDKGVIIIPKKVGYPKNSLKWPVTPEILYYMPKFLYERYQLPILITENGVTLSDWVSLDGKVHDPNRIDFIRRYLRELKRAVNEGVPVIGYFSWSIMDNFEWSEGYNERFGLIYVDYETQERIPKDSAYFYRDVIATNGENL